MDAAANAAAMLSNESRGRGLSATLGGLPEAAVQRHSIIAAGTVTGPYIPPHGGTLHRRNRDEIPRAGQTGNDQPMPVKLEAQEAHITLCPARVSS